MKIILPWLQGLAAAFISGAAHAVVVAGVLPEMLQTKAGIIKLATVGGASGVISASLYLTKSPLPGLNQTAAPTKPSP